MTGLVPERIERIVVLGAHCDDIAIGAGGSDIVLGTTGRRGTRRPSTSGSCVSSWRAEPCVCC
ncbi:hypothetical protein CF166_06615 [Amycolatopsis sp. KNN50.9b]|nr:hypothetical protein CF166_06615 [Amycolatopsis sp. KNN50.9b]